MNLAIRVLLLIHALNYVVLLLSFVHHSDVIIRAMASRITNVSIVYSTVCSGANQRKHQSSASLAFVRGIHWWPGYSPHKGSATRKMFQFDDVTMVSKRCPGDVLTLWWMQFSSIINNEDYLYGKLQYRILGKFKNKINFGSEKSDIVHRGHTDESKPSLFLMMARNRIFDKLLPDQRWFTKELAKKSAHLGRGSV